MLLKGFLPTVRNVAALSSLSLLVACGGSKDPSTAIYDVTFTGTWGAETHPTMIPAGTFPTPSSAPHFSPIVVATHNSQVDFWKTGQAATPGTEIIAETGKPTTFIEEVDAAIAAGTAHSMVRGGSGFISPGTQSVAIQVNSDFPKATFLTMIAPSPDWFAGARIESLLSDGAFVDKLTVDVKAYDAGTDDGNSYQSPDDDTQPRGVIQGLFTDPQHTSFTTEEKRTIGTLTFVKQ